jgi:hypothetical protein
MRIMAKITIPAAPGNRAISDGTIGKLMQGAAERWHPEAMYFTTFDGQRTAYLVVDFADPSDIPPFAEPFFSGLEASVEMAPVMNTEDLQKGLGRLS